MTNEEGAPGESAPFIQQNPKVLNCHSAASSIGGSMTPVCEVMMP